MEGLESKGGRRLESKGVVRGGKMLKVEVDSVRNACKLSGRMMWQQAGRRCGEREGWMSMPTQLHEIAGWKEWESAV